MISCRSATRCCAIIRSRRICAFCSRNCARRCGSISSRARPTACRSRATSAPSSTSAPRWRSTSGRSARSSTSTPRATNGCAIRSRRSRSPSEPFRIVVGGPDCAQPYSASVFNISAMSFGALSANAIRALNSGAALGGFAHDTGEGGYSPYHREGGGDVIWEIGSGYFGCRTADGAFDRRQHSPPTAANDQIKMIEIKLSQGAKPGHGGVLPAAKVTRGDRRDPRRADGRATASRRRATRAFSTPIEMMRFIAELRRPVRRQAGRLQALRRPPLGVPGDLQGDAGDRTSVPTSSSSTARRAAPARRRSNSPTTSACRCARGWSSCTTR